MKLHSLISSRYSKARQAAFSLVEVTVGMGLMGMVTMALLTGFTSGFFTMRMARENLRATQIMLEKTETIRLYSWDQINTPGFIPTNFVAVYDPMDKSNAGLTYQGSMTITDCSLPVSYSNNMKRVTVRLDWVTGGLSRTREFTSYISRNGLQNYIY